MITTSDNIHLIKNHYNDIKSCIEDSKNQKNTNKRYSFFTQTHFTAGDYDQFFNNLQNFNSSNIFKIPKLIENRFSTIYKPHFYCYQGKIIK